MSNSEVPSSEPQQTFEKRIRELEAQLKAALKRADNELQVNRGLNTQLLLLQEQFHQQAAENQYIRRENARELFTIQREYRKQNAQLQETQELLKEAREQLLEIDSLKASNAHFTAQVRELGLESLQLRDENAKLRGRIAEPKKPQDLSDSSESPPATT